MKLNRDLNFNIKDMFQAPSTQWKKHKSIMCANETWVWVSVSCYHAGLRIISNLDEVAFIQNLVFYIEAAYKVAVSSIVRGLGVSWKWMMRYDN